MITFYILLEADFWLTWCLEDIIISQSDAFDVASEKEGARIN